ncbi:hypothetical protein EPICR_130051 [Candidatus Desulfarcum epimagneticum]|uniref:Uncharacterized protein n=1 Tax=uncultured Desulfobacteraceae bacterium TaxID=218296 RepID=A0A484HFS6_9BACT|nr:hypothetical protein EPICR_130051 [uncultured Desulfobacteraceae bacterium]
MNVLFSIKNIKWKQKKIDIHFLSRINQWGGISKPRERERTRIMKESRDNGESALACMKHGIRVDADRADCRDPEIYRKFRPSCLIWFIRKERRRKEKRENP